MRIIKSGDTEIGIRAGGMALFFYQKEFKKDLIKTAFGIFGDMSQANLSDNAENSEDAFEVDGRNNIFQKDNFSIPILEILEIVWAMAKAERFFQKKSFPNFEAWLSKHDDFSVLDCLIEIFEEITDGFFRSGEKVTK